MQELLTIHSILRWLIILVAIAAIVKLALGLFKKQAYDKMTRGLVAGFAGLMDTQFLLGLMFFIWNGMLVGFGGRERWEHLFVMLIATAVAHLPAKWKNAEDPIRQRNTLYAIVGALALVVVGVSLLPGNRWLRIAGLF
jgi:hypothetical protein